MANCDDGCICGAGTIAPLLLCIGSDDMPCCACCIGCGICC